MGETHEELVTGRLSLRRPVPGDIDAIHAIHRDPLACAHNPSDQLTARDEAEQLFHRWDAHWSSHGFGYWTVRTAGAPGPAGFCGLKVMEFRDRMVLNLFYRFAPAHWGAGLGTEAATAVVEWAAAHRPDHSVIARVRPANTASAKVAARAGLTRAAHLDGPGHDGHDLIFTAGNSPG
ncbi:GNAT family N-acetyltransferase [Amycolatopsis sp. YIM 10]|uniref:GNAT family N-acetyltransferase n=1 Tax=Amycolatopsis sp. YIM 10 TaxID=2653857 RepID=UPI00128FF69C|nr:GNAT family N-acetyltransferase [Amycolatopsis sp. YIM 10]QFU92395.1 Acetyltransferase (GNAT) family protein [Amycolatopsis sp. YIM 10]